MLGGETLIGDLFFTVIFMINFYLIDSMQKQSIKLQPQVEHQSKRGTQQTITVK